jgi:hypothetical protein
MPENKDTPTLVDDIVEGAGPIAAFLYGRDTPETRKRVYYENSTKQLPIVQLRPGGRLRLSKLATRKMIARPEVTNG